jgi:translation initiation factor 2 beta subunit (eIF-2beta)/eIF-5
MEDLMYTGLNTLTSSKINICGEIDNPDPFFRYKMDAPIIKHEGGGNGKKTRISNIESIAEQLHRTPEEIIRFLGVELSTTSKYIENSAILNGHMRQDDLNSSINKYIETFVICKKCRLPEIPKYKLDGKGIKTKCLGCGDRNKIDKDYHRLVSYIVSQLKLLDKEKDTSKKKKKSKKDKT